MFETKKFFLTTLAVISVTLILSLKISQSSQGTVGGAYLEAVPYLPLADDLQKEAIPVPKSGHPPPPPFLTAKAVLVKDRSSGVVIYEKDSKLRLPIASLTKLMTAVVVYENVVLQEEVKIEAADLETSYFKAGLAVREELLVRDLLKAMLIGSANDATLALARHVAGSIDAFTKTMNDKAESLGMGGTSFTNPVGFDDPDHYSRASDLAILVEKFTSYPELLEIVGQQEAFLSSIDGEYNHHLVTTNKLMLKYPEIVGLKTGYTAEARGNLIILVSPPEQSFGEYYSILLGSQNREAESETLMNWVKENFIWQR